MIDPQIIGTGSLRQVEWEENPIPILKELLSCYLGNLPRLMLPFSSYFKL